MVVGAGPGTLAGCFVAQAILIFGAFRLNQPSEQVLEAAAPPGPVPAVFPTCPVPAPCPVVQVSGSSAWLQWFSLAFVGTIAFLAGIGCNVLLSTGGSSLVGAAAGAVTGAVFASRSRDEEVSGHGVGAGSEDLVPIPW